MLIRKESLYRKIRILVSEDEYQGEGGIVTPEIIYKPHETANSPLYWVVSNERTSKAGITVLKNKTNEVLAVVNIENTPIPVVQLDGTLGSYAPKPSEGSRHPHGIAIDYNRKRVYQVIEHSGLQWTADRKRFMPATSSDTESGLLVVYDICNPINPRLLYGYVLGHAAEEVAVNLNNGKVYVGNHEPSPTNAPCFVSVIKTTEKKPYAFIDLPPDDCVQGISVDHYLNTVNATTHIGQKMYIFNSDTDTIDYSVDIRAPFDAYIKRLPKSQQFEIPGDWVIHMHDLVTDSVNHVAYQTIHSIGTIVEEEENDEDTNKGSETTKHLEPIFDSLNGEYINEESETDAEEDTHGEAETDGEVDNQITGRWVVAVNTNPCSAYFKKVKIIDLSNGQSVPEVPTHEDAIKTGLPYNQLFVHAHFVAIDPFNCTLLVTGEHTGNIGVVDMRNWNFTQVISISRQIPGYTLAEEPEPHVHGVSADREGTVYVSDEGENGFYESVTILKSFRYN